MPSSKVKRIPVGAINLQFAGELILPKLPDPDLAGMFRRFQVIFEHLANLDREERILSYKMINGLMLTSYAKKSSDNDQKKQLFDKKNALFVGLANDRSTRRKMAFKYLQSKNFRVLAFCSECQTRNTESKLERHQWKFCSKCDVDRNFFNVLSMHHKFDKGSFTLFLSNDHIERLEGIQLKNKGKLEDFKEEALFTKYRYNIKNLDTFDLDSVLEMNRKLMG